MRSSHSRRLAEPDRSSSPRPSGSRPGRGALPLVRNFFVLVAPGVATAAPGTTSLDLHIRSRGAPHGGIIHDPSPPPVAPGEWNRLEHFGTLGTLFPGRPAGSDGSRSPR